MANDPASPASGISSGEPPVRNAWYWFRHNVKIRTKRFAAAHRKALIVTGIISFVLLILLRAFVHPLVIALRSHIYIFTIGVPFAALLYYVLRKRSWKLQISVLATLAVIAVAVAYSGALPHEYTALYLRFRSLKIHELKDLPLTTNDRIQPHNSIVSLAHEAMADTETPGPPNFVRIGNDYRWVIPIEPAFLIRRATNGVGEVFNVPGTAPSPNFSRESRVAVDFPTGEELLIWNNTAINVIRSFSPWRFLNYEPADVKYVTDDHGEWVQVVSLIRWRGLFFTWPEFGGVHILRQSKHGGNSVLRPLVGTGEWIPPEDIAKHAFLKGQNLMPEAVSRAIANSLRYQGGFFAPFPGYHLGDIRIPDLPDDVNEQPFTICFEFPNHEAPNMMYHYLALEPFQADKQGLNTSVFIPADGSDVVYTYHHSKKSEALTGVSAIGPKVMESRKQYDWSRNRPVEHRPYIKKIDGKTRFFWLTTVVTLKDSHSQFIAGSTPDVVLTDAAYKVVTWVDPLKPDEWGAQVQKNLSGVWKHEEPTTGTAVSVPTP